MKHAKTLIFISLIFVIGCSIEKEEDIKVESDNRKNVDAKIKQDVEVIDMKLTSQDFKHNGMMPSELTCDGDDTSPELNIEDVPKNAESLVLINDDPDAPAGVWDHWIVFNIPPTTAKINKGKEPEGIGGKNGWGKTGYGGPCPPSGTHRYFFKLYALDIELDLQEGASKSNIERAMKGHILAQAELMGNYKRQ